jgi:hypothetical protein
LLAVTPVRETTMIYADYAPSDHETAMAEAALGTEVAIRGADHGSSRPTEEGGPVRKEIRCDA